MRKNKKYLEFIRTKSCIFCGKTEVIAHHIRNKLFTPISMRGGTSLKPFDTTCVPLCHECHTDVHELRKTIENPHYHMIELMNEYISKEG